MPKKNLNISAVFRLQNYTVTYILNGGTNSGGNPVNYTMLTPTLYLNNPIRIGFPFVGWYADSGFVTPVSQIPLGSTGNKTFYAKWPPSYTITYNLKGGVNNSSNPSFYTPLTATFTFANPTFTVYTFEGWFADSTFTIPIDQVQLGSTGNINLYAKWYAIRKMVPIPAGSFLLGADGLRCDTAGNENLYGDTVHVVTLSAFTMSETDITQSQYTAVMGSNPSHFNLGLDAPNRPVEEVSWYDALRFCNKLSQSEGKTQCYDMSNLDSTKWTCNISANDYRLPTEAEWEYAAKANSMTIHVYYWGDNLYDTTALNANAWWSCNSNGITHPVATKTKNAFGLYDISGNVFQMCNDWYGRYFSAPQDNPTGQALGITRVQRGGCFVNPSSELVNANRTHRDYPLQKSYWVGFRIVASGQ